MNPDEAAEHFKVKRERYTFSTGKEAERQWRAPWPGEQAIAHGTHEGGIWREVPCEGREVEDGDLSALKALVEGQTITGIEREPDSGEAWNHDENAVTLTLSNGVVLEFSGWGYDASGCATHVGFVSRRIKETR